MQKTVPYLNVYNLKGTVCTVERLLVRVGAAPRVSPCALDRWTSLARTPTRARRRAIYHAGPERGSTRHSTLTRELDAPLDANSTPVAPAPCVHSDTRALVPNAIRE